MTRPTHVHTTEPQEVGRIYGPSGEVIATIIDRQPLPFGFQPPTNKETLDTDSVQEVY